MLDGVPFVMAGRAGRSGGAARAQELQACLEATQVCLDGAQEALARSRRHDFQLERDVVKSDITATMRRMHLANTASYKY